MTKFETNSHSPHTSRQWWYQSSICGYRRQQLHTLYEDM